MALNQWITGLSAGTSEVLSQLYIVQSKLIGFTNNLAKTQYNVNYSTAKFDADMTRESLENQGSQTVIQGWEEIGSSIATGVSTFAIPAVIEYMGKGPIADAQAEVNNTKVYLDAANEAVANPRGGLEAANEQVDIDDAVINHNKYELINNRNYSQDPEEQNFPAFREVNGRMELSAEDAETVSGMSPDEARQMQTRARQANKDANKKLTQAIDAKNNTIARFQNLNQTLGNAISGFMKAYAEAPLYNARGQLDSAKAYLQQALQMMQTSIQNLITILNNAHDAIQSGSQANVQISSAGHA